MTNPTITHNPDTQRFETTIDGHTAYLSYAIIDGNTLNYHYTLVPPQLGGRGVGTALVKHAVEYAEAEGKQIIPSCSFVANYMNKHQKSN